MGPSTLIFGGHGKCALYITKLLIAQGHQVHSIIRNPDQKSELEQLGAQPIVLDIEQASVDDMAEAIRSSQAGTVLWCAGAGYANPDHIKAVDQDGAIRTFDAAAKAGVHRYVSISALDVRDRDKVPFPSWYSDQDKIISGRVYRAIKPHLDAKFEADKNLVTENGRRKLDYTIVRPGGLSPDSAKGSIDAGKVHLGAMITREDVAAVVVECLKNDDTNGLVFDVVGGDTKLSDAVARLAKDRTDTFEGTY